MTVKVLVVEDEPNVLKLIQIKLGKEGFDVSTASDG